MKDEKKEKMKDRLVQAGLMDQNDNIIESLLANYWDKIFLFLGKWKKGYIFFTENQIVYPTGIFSKDIVIPYKNIRKIVKCSQGFFPMGIAITYEDPKTRDQITNKFSIAKREKWMEFLAEKAGISLDLAKIKGIDI